MKKTVKRVEKVEKTVNAKSFKVMSIKKISEEDIETLFENAFRDQVASYNNIDEFEVKSTRDIKGNSLKVEVTVQGLAGSPTSEDFKNMNIDNIESVTISREDIGELTLKLMPKETTPLNATEYIVVYQS